eukprot:6213189-Pleurochrysis_carterae.AAC.1
MARHNMPTAYAMSGRLGVRHDSPSFRVQCVRDDKREVGAGRRVVTLERRGHAFGQISVDKLRDILLLLEQHAVCISCDVHVEQIRHWALVLHVPTVQGIRGAVGVEDEQVVDVAPDNYRLRHAANGFGTSKDARARCALPETPGLEPREQGRCQRRPAWAIPYTGLNMRHTRVRPSDPVVSYKIPSTHGHSALDRESGEGAKRGGSHRCAGCLFKIHSGYLCASLHAESRFQKAATLSLVYPNQSHKGAPGGDRGAVDEFPAAVAGVVCDFCSFRGCPARSMLAADARSAELLCRSPSNGRRALRTVRSAAGVLLRSGSSSVSRDSGCEVSEDDVGRPSVAELGGAMSARRSVLRSSLDEVSSGEEEALGTSRVMREATALAMSMFRSGGYAACDADFQQFSSRAPPTLDVCVR